MAKILIVDDIADNVKLLEYTLLDEGYDVVTAYSGREALDVTRLEMPDAILLDNIMPGGHCRNRRRCDKRCRE